MANCECHNQVGYIPLNPIKPPFSYGFPMTGSCSHFAFPTTPWPHSSPLLVAPSFVVSSPAPSRCQRPPATATPGLRPGGWPCGSASAQGGRDRMGVWVVVFVYIMININIYIIYLYIYEYYVCRCRSRCMYLCLYSVCTSIYIKNMYAYVYIYIWL